MTKWNPKRERVTSTYVIRWLILACNLLRVRVSFTPLFEKQLLKNRNPVGTIKMQMSSTEVQSILREYELHYGAWNLVGATHGLLMSQPSFVIYTSRAPLSSIPSREREREEKRDQNPCVPEVPVRSVGWFKRRFPGAPCAAVCGSLDSSPCLWSHRVSAETYQ